MMTITFSQANYFRVTFLSLKNNNFHIPFPIREPDLILLFLQTTPFYSDFVGRCNTMLGY